MELIDGREVQKHLPSRLHAVVETFLLVALARDVPRMYEVLPELNVWCGYDRLVPDLAVARRDARYENGDLVDAAVFAVEILSPSQRLPDLLDKADRIVRAGTRMCWVFWPEVRRAWMYTLEDMIETRQVISAPLGEGDQIEISLEELWSQLKS